MHLGQGVRGKSRTDSAPVAAQNIVRRTLPGMAVAALPVELGPSIDIPGRETLAPAVPGEPAHILKGIRLFPHAGPAPVAAQNTVRQTVPDMAVRTLPAQLGLRIDISRRETLPAARLRELVHLGQGMRRVAGTDPAPAAAQQVFRRPLPGMAVLAAPAQLGLRIDILRRETLSAARPRELLHLGQRVRGNPTTGPAPAAAQQIARRTLPRVAVLTLPAQLGLCIDILRRETLPATLLRESLHLLDRIREPAAHGTPFWRRVGERRQTKRKRPLAAARGPVAPPAGLWPMRKKRPICLQSLRPERRTPHLPIPFRPLLPGDLLVVQNRGRTQTPFHIPQPVPVGRRQEIQRLRRPARKRLIAGRKGNAVRRKNARRWCESGRFRPVPSPPA